MTRYISLSCDVKPEYAIWAPIVTRLWKRLGWTPILFQGGNAVWAETAFARYVEGALCGVGKQVSAQAALNIPRCAPLSLANTMRCIRLVGAVFPGIEPDDLVMTADIDMAPISRTFFEEYADSAPFVLRADMHGSLDGASALAPNSQRRCIPGLFRFPMCYVGLTAQQWWDILPCVKNEPVASLRLCLQGLRADQVDFDEALCSARLLSSKYAQGPLEPVEEPGRFGIREWVQGRLTLVPMTKWPEGWPRRMRLAGPIKDPIDYHMKALDQGVGDALCGYWPEEADFIRGYFPRALELARQL